MISGTEYYRRKARLSLQELSRRTGIAVKVLRKLCDEPPMVTPTTIYMRAAAELGVKAMNLLFWKECAKQKQPAKSEASKLRAEKKAQKRAEGSLLRGLRDSFQRYADAAGAEIIVVRVEPMNQHTYRAFYVSDNPFPDWNMFPAFLEAVGRAYPSHNISLRRIKNLDGHFVTRNVRRTFGCGHT